MISSFSGLKERASNVLKSAGVEKFDQFPEAKDGYETMGSESGSPSEEFERPPLRHVDKYLKPQFFGLTARYTVSIMAMIGFIISFGMKNNVSTAKIAKRSLTGSSGLNWTVDEEIFVDSSFFYGYLITQIPAGFFASYLPATKIFGASIAASSFLNLLIMGAMSLDNVTVLCTIRFIQGLTDGVTYPSCHGIWRFWAPPLERSRLATLAFCGSYAGLVLVFPLGTMLTDHISWKAPFYCYSAMGLTWYLFWLWLIFEKPRKHPTISIEEVKYIEKALGASTQVAMPTIATTPWTQMVRSMPVYAIIVANFCRSWNFYMLVNYQTPFLKRVYNISLTSAGMYGALPHLTMAIIVPCGGILADHLRKTGAMSTTNVRKMFNCCGFGLEAFFFVVLAHATTKFGAIVALILGVGLSGFAISGYNVNHLDIAPKYASILMGISNGIGTSAGILCPIAIDSLTKDEPKDRWSVVLTIGALVHLFGITFYAIFASGELQSWAEECPIEQSRPVLSPSKMGYIQETTFTNTTEDPSMQMQANHTNYGATQHVANNPFAAGAMGDVMEENVQPTARDVYMHGTVDDRNY